MDLKKAKELAVKIIKFFEGCKLEAYVCPAGVLTIGIGSTKNVKPGMVITEEEAIQRLLEDLADSQKRIENMINIDLNENEYAALLSLGFNVSYKSSEKLSSYLNSDKELFKQKLLLYCNGGGKILKGLKIRRIAERLLFENQPWEEKARSMQNMSLEGVLEYEKVLFAGGK